MAKKFITACMAVVAFAAFGVLPTFASAANSPQLTHPTGTLLAKGTKIKGTNIGETLMTDTSGNVLTRCTSATLTGELTKNESNTVEGNVSSAAFSGSGTEGRCTATFGDSIVNPNPATNGLPWCIRSTSTMAEDEVQIRGNACSSASRPIRFILTTSVGECAYERTTAIVGTYTTDTAANNNSDAVVHISKQLFTLIGGGTSGFFCPSEGLLDMSFTLETDTSTPEPLYFS